MVDAFSVGRGWNGAGGLTCAARFSPFPRLIRLDDDKDGAGFAYEGEG